MTAKLLRGRVLSFHAEPQAGDESAFTYIEDGALLLRDGVIERRGEYCDLKGLAEEEVDHRPHLLMAGFIDAHIHFPQVQVVASWGEQLLDWLENYTFPAEMKYADPSYAARMAGAYFDLLAAHGTTTAASYCTVHPESVEAYFGEAEQRNMCMIGGKVMMDRGAPQGLCDTPQRGYDESKALIEKWHGRGRAHYAITPRFAITSTAEQLEATQALAAEHPECFVQTHVDENQNEIALAAELFPDAPDYMGVYEQYGLLRENALLGHCIHMTDREIGLVADTGAKPVFCPTSNLFLGSGLYDDAGLRKRGIKGAIATDVGGGTSYSMLQSMNEGYKVLQLQRQQKHPYEAFHWITRGNAVALGLEDRIGTLDEGSDADIVVLDARATAEMRLRAETVETLAEELFLLMILGDDRAVVQTYVAGEPMK
ncbi:guanine deaminase [Alisedimentitalea sp. MJ-SS2]|uniref:guanine deaminase n=1 Tax=Aliisedimentitalea sp. MJ-SS2 TaxID=3049795 RepID=UPI002909D9F2|nr:guanine deaminase [Alisedimentitalea sp. MJ-SS2]MDU8929490.1 guanine deaminase [Alisedimentitalea sp. MJ-SS2]